MTPRLADTINGAAHRLDTAVRIGAVGQERFHRP